MFDGASYKARAIEFVTSKQVKPAFHQIFLRAVGCNWLVCLACYLGLQGKDLNSKIVAMWWPIFTFVSLGLDHGMFDLLLMIPKHQSLTIPSRGQHVLRTSGPLVGDTSSDRRAVHMERLVRGIRVVPVPRMGRRRNGHANSVSPGIIPAGLGNIVGGALFCGVYYYWMFIFREPAISIDGVYYQQKLEEGTLPTQSSPNSSSRHHLQDVTVDNSRGSSHELKREFHGLP